VTEFVLDLAPLAEPIELPAAILAARRARSWVQALLRPNGRVRWGTLRRTEPVSAHWGFDRGTPVDRVYIERFLEAHADDVRGRVLEVRNPGYTTAFGRKKVTETSIVDVDPTNPQATIVVDLGVPESLPAGSHDCVLVAQTLQYVADPQAAMANLWHTLAPGGVALVTVPCTSRVDPEAPDEDLWRFTPRGLERLIRRAGDWSELEVTGYGNVLASVAFLMGVAGEELRPSELAEQDSFFPLVVCARARKPA
jgi:SAM-dependent methyltransferase